MLKIATKSPNLIRIVYSSKWLSKFFVFDISGIDAVNDSALRNAIISNMTTPERHGETTAPGRFKDLDRVASKYVRPEGPNVVHDIGVSTGVTACDFYDAVFATLSVEYFISDKYTQYYYTGRRVVRVFDAEQRLLYGYVFSLLADGTLRPHYSIARLLFGILGRIPPSDLEPKEICLFDQTTIAYLNAGKLRSIEYDVFQTKIVDRFTYVRCMNVLNMNSWFGDKEISAAIAAICGSLVEGGILQIGRSRDDGTHDVGFFRKERGGMRLLESVNKGSELERAVMTCGALG